MAYDIIGDIHGQNGKLTALLEKKLGYRQKAGAYRHPAGRMALFLGDLIDRGPGQLEVIDIVRRMIDAGSGRTIMGNHELNAIGYATEDGRGGFLRQHTANKDAQHEAFLSQVGWRSNLHTELIDWFKTLPPVLDLGRIRLCHAWWNQDFVDCLSRNSTRDGRVKEEFLLSSFQKDSEAYEVMEGLTKGMEVKLPDGVTFTDHAGVPRTEIRLRWWDKEAKTFRSAALGVQDLQRIPDVALPVTLGCENTVPTFLGHYWLEGKPTVQNSRIAVLDYGAAAEGRPLVAYRWDGETELDNGNFVQAAG